MTGEDALFYGALTQGADGGILAAAHVETARFASVRNIFVSGDQQGALRAWRALVDLPRLLFAEPSPAPIKHWLWRAGLIDSPEVRAADDAGQRHAGGAHRTGDGQRLRMAA